MEGWRQRRTGSSKNKSLIGKEKTVLTRTGLLMEGLGNRLEERRYSQLHDSDKICTVTKVRLSILRGIASFLLLLSGFALSLFSVAIAGGFGRRPMSVGGLIVAIVGLAFMFGGYWIIRDMDGALLAAVCLKIALGIGSIFTVFGMLALFITKGNASIPIGYFIALGCICIFGFVKFRAYTRDR